MEYIFFIDVFIGVSFGSLLKVDVSRHSKRFGTNWNWASSKVVEKVEV